MPCKCHGAHGLRVKSVVHGAMPMPGAHIRPCSQGRAQIGAPALHRLHHVAPQGQMCGNGGRQGAARAVGVAGMDARIGKYMFAAIGQHQHIAQRIACQMPAFDQHGRRAALAQGMRGYEHVLHIADFS